MRGNLRLPDLGILRLPARLTAGLGLRAQTAQGTSSLDPCFKNLTMVKFLGFLDGSLLTVNEQGKTQARRRNTRRILPFYHLARINRSKTVQDASSSRRVRIRRRERTHSYVTKTKRKLDEEIRSGFSPFTTSLE